MVVSIRTSRALVAAASLALLGACDDKPTNLVVPAPIGATLTVNPGSDGQTGVVGEALANPISVHVSDAAGNALAGVLVNWTVVGDGGSVSATSTTTDINGNTSVTWTLGLTAGVDSLVASLNNGVSVTITATAVAGPFSNLALVSGDAQSVTAGTVTAPLVVRAVDANGNPVSGVDVTWATTGGGTLSATTTTTGDDGTTSVTLTTSATAGPYTVTATSGSSSVTFNGSGT